MIFPDFFVTRRGFINKLITESVLPLSILYICRLSVVLHAGCQLCCMQAVSCVACRHSVRMHVDSTVCYVACRQYVMLHVGNMLYYM